MVSRIVEWGNSQGIHLEKRMLQVLGLSVGDTVEISKKDDYIIIKHNGSRKITEHNIDWYLRDYERPDNDWEAAAPQGREVW